MTKYTFFYRVALSFLTLIVMTGLGCQHQERSQMGNRYVMASIPMTGPRLCEVDVKPRSWAVIAGVNYYQDPRIPDLKGAVMDAWNMYHYLVSPQGARFDPSQVKLLLNEEVTRANVEDALGQFLAAACPQDNVVIYFAGHGAPEPSRPEEAFLLVHDTKLDSMVSTAISMTRLPDFLKWRTGKTSRLFMLIDACHSGNIQFPGGRGFGASPVSTEDQAVVVKERAKSVNTSLRDMVTSQKGWGAISAAGADQVAGESGGLCQLGGEVYEGGLFTCALLKALDGQADKDRDNLLTFDELYTHVSDQLIEMRGLQQQPQKSGSMSGKSSVFPVIRSKLELPQIPPRYLTRVQEQPYRPWVYTSLAVTGAALASGIAMNLIANNSARDVNQYTATVETQPSGQRGYMNLTAAHESDRSTAFQLYLSTAVLGAITGSLFALDYFYEPEGPEASYSRAPKLTLTRAP